jgi:hypothetical protein
MLRAWRLDHRMSGKGSTRRGDREADRKYQAGWDAIFGSNAKSGHKTTKRVQARKATKCCKPAPIATEYRMPYPVWVCSDCCAKVGAKLRGETATWHTGDCEVCGITQWVTEPRDFNYPAFPGHEPRKTITMPEFWGALASSIRGLNAPLKPGGRKS